MHSLRLAMRFRATSVVFGVFVSACGGSDFQAADPGDGGAPSFDSAPFEDARAPMDTNSTRNDGEREGANATPDASPADDGVPEANGDRVVFDGTAGDVNAGDASIADTPPDRATDAPAT